MRILSANPATLSDLKVSHVLRDYIPIAYDSIFKSYNDLMNFFLRTKYDLALVTSLDTGAIALKLSKATTDLLAHKPPLEANVSICNDSNYGFTLNEEGAIETAIRLSTQPKSALVPPGILLLVDAVDQTSRELRNSIKIQMDDALNTCWEGVTLINRLVQTGADGVAAICFEYLFPVCPELV